MFSFSFDALPSGLSDVCLVVLTSQVMETLERLVLDCLRPPVKASQNPLQLAYQPRLGADDAAAAVSLIPGWWQGHCENRIV